MTDQRIQYNERMVGAGHPTLSDTLNRLSLIEHNTDGSHHWVDVRTYGADPTGVADSTTAFTNALAAGKYVFIPSGTYKITSTLTAASKWLFGTGSNGVTLNYTGTGACLNVSGSDATPSRVEGISITGTSSGSAGILVNAGLRRSIFRDLYVTGYTAAGAYGIDLAASLNNGIYYNLFEKVAVRSSANGLRLYSSDGAAQGSRANANTFNMVSLNDNAGNGLFVDYANGNTFTGFDTEGNVTGGTGYGVSVDHTAQIAFYGGYSENNPPTGGSQNTRGANFTVNSSGVHYLGRHNVDKINGTTGASGDVFFVDSTAQNLNPLIVDVAGNMTGGNITATGVSLTNAAVAANSIKFDSGTNGALMVGGTNYVLLGNNVITAMKPLSVQNTNAMLYAGAGSPETIVTANIGSLYLRTDGGAATTLYVKESGTGATGWVAK